MKTKIFNFKKVLLFVGLMIATTTAWAQVQSATPTNGGEYVIAIYKDSKYYALPNSISTSASTFAGTEVTLNGSGKVDASDATGLKWTLEASGTKWYIKYTESGTTYYLYKNGTSSSTNYNIKKVTSGQHTWAFTASGKGYDVISDRGSANLYLTNYAANSTNFCVRGSSVSVIYLLEVGSSTYTVTYNANNATSGTVPTDATAYSSGATVTVKGNTGNLAKTGWTFAGWNTNATGTGTNRAAGSTFSITANTTLYAKWTRTVTWSVNGATNVYPATTVTYNSSGSKVASVPTPPDPNDYCGQKFVGWTTQENVSQDDDTDLNLFTTAAGSPNLNSITTAVTFYAVFADYDE